MLALLGLTVSGGVLCRPHTQTAQLAAEGVFRRILEDTPGSREVAVAIYVHGAGLNDEFLELARSDASAHTREAIGHWSSPRMFREVVASDNSSVLLVRALYDPLPGALHTPYSNLLSVCLREGSLAAGTTYHIPDEAAVVLRDVGYFYSAMGMAQEGAVEIVRRGDDDSILVRLTAAFGASFVYSEEFTLYPREIDYVLCVTMPEPSDTSNLSAEELRSLVQDLQDYPLERRAWDDYCREQPEKAHGP